MRIVVFVLGLALGLSTGGSAAYGQEQTDSTYTVQSGDTVYSIAREVGVSVRALMRWNDLDDPTIEVGQTLRVRPPGESIEEEPVDRRELEPSDDEMGAAEADTAVEADTATAAADTSTSYGRHTVEPGDTFVSLALRLGTTSDTLFALNDSTTAPLAPERTLRLPGRFAAPRHVVQSGETLYSIAGEYGVSVRALQAENDLDPTDLQPGQQLRIPGRTAPNVSGPGEWAAPDSTGRVAVYPDAFNGRLTASGTTYDPGDFVVSHPSLAFDSVVLLSTQDSTRHTFARVIDRGPVEEGVLLDVSGAVAQKLGLAPDDVSTVSLRVVWRAGDAD